MQLKKANNVINIKDAKAMDKPNKPKFKVLVIDDEEGILEIVSEHATQLGFHVFTANTAEKARDYVEYCDGILSDVNMPDRATLEEILSQARNKVPIIRFSAENQSRAVGVTLKKPFSLQDIENTLNDLVQFAALNKMVA